MFVSALCFLLVSFAPGESHLIAGLAKAHAASVAARVHAHEAAEKAKFHVAKAQLHALRSSQPHPQQFPHHHTAVLPHFAVNYARTASDPRTILHHHHHHHHGLNHHGRGFHGGFHSDFGHGGFQSGFDDLQSDFTHQPLHKRPHTHMSQTIVNNINARRAFDHPRHELGRWKRELPQIAAARIVADPHVKLNVIGTVDNLKDATADLLEHEHSPFYHVREAVGSARDAFFSLLKTAPNGLLVPTSYTIAEIEEVNPEAVGAAKEEGDGPGSSDVPKNTLNTLQMMIRNGFRSARDSATHAGDTIHSVRRAVLAFPRTTLKFLLPYLRALELEREKKGLPKGLLGTSLKRASPNELPKIVGAGRIMDLLRKAASKDDSGEIVAQAQCPKRDMKETYKQFLNRLKERVNDKINSL